MITIDHIRTKAREHGYSLRKKEAEQLQRLLEGNYNELVKWQVFLSDVPYQLLNDQAKRNFFESTLDLWITMNPNVKEVYHDSEAAE